MNIALLIIILILLCICIFLIIKLFLIKSSIKEIEDNFDYILKSDTNNLITISSSDKDIKKLAININDNLKKLRIQKLQYENGNQELKQIITNISHDLRTPLTAIKGYVELIKEDKVSTKQEEYIKIIQKKSNEMTDLTEQLFKFSEIIDVKTDKKECCINEILEEVLVSYYNIFKEKNITAIVNICSQKIYKIANKLSFIRIFENILSNVAKYSTGDFKIVMNKTGRITFSNKADSLDATTVQKIFDRYFSVENAKNSTGIGLSITKQLIELNDCNIMANYIDKHLIIEIDLRPII